MAGWDAMVSGERATKVRASRCRPENLTCSMKAAACSVRWFDWPNVRVEVGA